MDQDASGRRAAPQALGSPNGEAGGAVRHGAPRSTASGPGRRRKQPPRLSPPSLATTAIHNIAR